MEKSNVLLVGVWGFPASWYLARYKPLLPPSRIASWSKLAEWRQGEVLETHSTLTALAAALSGNDWRICSIVYGLDTLASPSWLDPNRIEKNDRLRRRLVEETNRLIDGFVREDPQDYEEVKRRAETILGMYVKEYFKEVGISTEGCNADNGFVFKVIPGVGSYSLKTGETKKEYVYSGSPQNTLAALELDMYRVLLHYKPQAIILDISHGVNYLPVLAVAALRWAVKAYSALEGTPVSVAIVNSDPVTSYGQDARIHLVNVRIVESTLLNLLGGTVREIERQGGVSGISIYKMIRKMRPPISARRLGENILGILNRYYSCMKSIASITEYGLMLYTVESLLSLDPEELERSIQILEGALEEALQRSIEANSGTIRIYWGYEVNTALVLDTIYALYALRKLAREAEDIISTKDLERYKMIDIETLRAYAERIGLQRPARTILSNELNDIKRKTNDYMKSHGVTEFGPTPYKLIHSIAISHTEKAFTEKTLSFEELERDAEKKKCKANERNFYAHAGLEENLIAVAVKDGRVLIGYHPECLSAIKKLVERS